MLLLRGHLLATSVVAVGAVAIGMFFAFARPTAQRHVMSLPSDHGLPYPAVSYTASDARRAFAAEGIALAPRSRSATITTLGNRNDIVEVDTFAAREKVERAGFYNYTIVNGEYAPFPATCDAASASAALWRGNVRAVISCTAAGGDAATWLHRVERALARL